MDDNASFGYWMQRRRKALDLTQATLAQRVGCSTGMIRMIEADARRPSRQLAELLSAHLEIAAPDRAAFVQAARAEVGVNRLDLPAPATVVASPPPAVPRHAPVPPPALGHAGERALHNLPAQSTTLIGRKQAVANVCTLLRRADVRLVTLHGPGGIGKTRLAFQAGADVLDDFADGVWVVELAPIRDPAFVVTAIADALGIKETGGQPLVETLKAFVREHQVLLVLDNFEHVVAAAPIVADLLKAAPRLVVLVTSREVLRLSGEHTFPVPPLDLPDRRALPPPTALRQYAAVALFLQRAQAVRPDFEITDATAPAVAEICTRLDGLPLAIELAAARSNLFSPQALLTRLGTPLTLLTGGARDLHARQQTLRATIDWSYALLDPSEQRLFARLAVFVGGCTLEAAEAVCADVGDRRRAVVDGLASLVDKSLVRQQDDIRGEPRFTMLETIREYALERLAISGEVEAVRGHHAVLYLTLAEDAEARLRGPEQLMILRRLETEHDNLRVALQWLAAGAASDPEAFVRLVAALWYFWFLRGYWGEWERWREAALGQAGWQAGAGMSTIRPGLLRHVARLLLGHAWRANFEHAGNEADIASDSLALFQAAGDRWGSAAALVILGALDHFLAEEERGKQRIAQGIALARDTGDPWLVAWAMLDWAAFNGIPDISREGRAHVEESLRLARVVGDPGLIALALDLASKLPRLQGQYAEARRLLQESLSIRRELGDSIGVAYALCDLGMAALDQGDYEGVRTTNRERLAIERKLGNPIGVADALTWLSLAERGAGNIALAEALAHEALVVVQEMDAETSTIAVKTRTTLGMVAYTQGDIAGAKAEFAWSLATARKNTIPWFIGLTLYWLGRVALAQQDIAGARAHFSESLRAFQDLDIRPDVLNCLDGLASAASAGGRSIRAARLGGAAEVQREHIQQVVPPVDREEYERYLSGARAQCDTAAWNAAWAEGRAMPLEQAVAYALEIGDPAS